MDFVSLLLIFAGLFNIVWVSLFLRSYFRGVNRKIANFFIFNVVTVFSWIVVMFFYRLSQDNATILLLCRLLYVAAALIPVTFLYFAYFFPEGVRKHSQLTIVLILLPVVFLLCLTLFTNTIIFNAYKISGQEHFIVWGSLYLLYVIYVPVYFSWSFLILLKRYRENAGFIRLQALYILIGVSISSFIGMITNLILPSFYFFKFNWVGQVATIIWAASTIYPIARYRLSDIRIIFRKVFVYVLSAIFAYGVFYLLIWFYNKFLGGFFTTPSYVSGMFIAIIFVGMFLWFYNAVQKFANKYLFFSLYSHQETIAKLTDELTNSIDLSKIVDSIVDSIKQSMQLDRAGVLLINQSEGVVKYKIEKVIGFNENNGISLVQDNFLTQHLEKTQKPLVRDEIQLLEKNSVSVVEKQSFSQLTENMKHIEASLCLPMIISSKLIGIIVLGSKISGDAYTSDDLNLLNTLSKQAAIAVDNARLYKEVQDFSKTLQQKVDEQTKEIRGQKNKVEKALAVEKQANELEKHANEELKHLDENKTDFMLITQHHLRTPLSVNNGFLDLILNGTFGKVPQKLKDVISRLSESTQKEIDVVNELLDVSSYQIGKEVIHFHPIDFEALMEETLKDLTAEAEAKGIYLKYEKQGELPKVPADRMKLKLVLTNVIDNCIKYTGEGGVTVNMKVKNDKFLISVTDTGIGLSEEVMQNLFKQSFHRGEQAKKLFAVGKGLGLYLSGKIIEGHHGRIWAESRGDGKGSVFNIELPLQQEASQPIKVEDNVSANTK